MLQNRKGFFIFLLTAYIYYNMNLFMVCGRFSTFDIKYCDMVVDHLAEGGTLADFAAQIGVTYATIWNWQNENACFFDSIKKGREICDAIFKEKFLKDAVRDNTIQAVPFIMYCRNVLKAKTRDDIITPEVTSDSQNANIKLINYLDSLAKK